MKSSNRDLHSFQFVVAAGWCLLGMALVLAVPNELLAQGCAMCKTAVGGADEPLARGLNVSILFLLSMPFVLAGSVGGWFFYLYRRSRRHVPLLRLVETAKEGNP